MSGESISYPHHRHGTAGGFPTTSRPSADQSRTDLRSDTIKKCGSMATCYPTYNLSSTQHQQRTAATVATVAAAVHQVPQKDFNRPLHVDCSVEYELPNAAKPPQGVRNEPLLMIHPCYFRKIESQRRSPFVNNLPSRTSQTAAVAAVAAASKRRHRPQQYPVPQYAAAPAAAPHERQPQAAWEPMPPLVPISQAAYCKQQQQQRDHHHHQHHHPAPAAASAYSSSGSDSGHWTDPDRSPDRPEDKHILSGKYRQYLRHHRLHPYVTSAIPLASTFPQIQQVCYNV